MIRNKVGGVLYESLVYMGMKFNYGKNSSGFNFSNIWIISDSFTLTQKYQKMKKRIVEVIILPFMSRGNKQSDSMCSRSEPFENC